MQARFVRAITMGRVDREATRASRLHSYVNTGCAQICAVTRRLVKIGNFYFAKSTTIFIFQREEVFYIYIYIYEKCLAFK